MRTANKETKERFIKAAISEIREHGIADFSIRRVAVACGTTSGAPYRHFKDKNMLILEVLQYINNKWYEAQREIVLNTKGGCRELIVEISLGYIRFLHENPEFQTILMMNDSTMTDEQKVEKAKISEVSAELIHRYCDEVNMADADRIRKTYAVRSFIYGAALMLNSGYMPYNNETLEMARSCIDREFDLA
ncbi:MAG: TetR/AcrR family transcriptional regulator [Clostridia bacterium]|nr:TetR/AcrR family transcriptional regulator [Clostridia bacterium]